MSVTIPPESIAVGKCYLTGEGRVRRVLEILPDGRIRYRYRSFLGATSRTWRSGSLSVEVFAATAQREVPCDWTPEGGDHSQEVKR